VQPLARDGLSADRVRQLLTAPVVEVDFGADLLDASDRFVEDISADLQDAKVSRSMYADVHGTCELTLMRELDWGVDRVRLWQTVSDGKETVKFHLGVFLPNVPEHKAGQDPRPREVSGMDKMWLLQREIGDTYVVPTGVSYLDAIRGVLTDAGVDGDVYLDGTRQDTLVDRPAVWLLTDQPATWLRPINDLLAMIGYRGMWVSPEGRFRSQPYKPPTESPSEWLFDLGDLATNIVGEDRELTGDVWDAPNWWRFVRRQESEPTVGDGIYQVDMIGDDLPRRRVVFLDAADQASLVSQGEALVSEDVRNVRLLKVDTGPLPAAGHFDVVDVRDADLVVGKCQARRWSLELATGRMEWEMEVL
jgi:hypothetical protein